MEVWVYKEEGEIESMKIRGVTSVNFHWISEHLKAYPLDNPTFIDVNNGNEDITYECLMEILRVRERYK